MNSFHDILRSIQERLKVSAYNYEKIAIIINTELAAPIKKEDIQIRKGVVYIRVTALVAHEVRLKKITLLSRLKEESFLFSDIRIIVE